MVPMKHISQICGLRSLDLRGLRGVSVAGMGCITTLRELRQLKLDSDSYKAALACRLRTRHPEFTLTSHL